MLNLNPQLKASQFEHAFVAVDSHTCGEFTRVIVGGIPDLKGDTMAEKKQYFSDHYDYIRTALMYEPRGHRDMFGAILTEPVSEEADFGIFFIETAGILNMCGHGTIGASTILVESGLVEVKEPYTDITYDTASGLVIARVRVEQGKAKEVSIRNVPSFLYKKDLETVINGKKIHYDLSFGGMFFTLVDVAQFNLEINQDTVNELIQLGMQILPQVNEEVEIEHPELGKFNTDVCEFYSSVCGDGADVRNVVVFGKSQADRSPCGTGTSAKMAALYARGEMKKGQRIINESFMGTRFKGEILDEVQVGSYTGILPQITGSAYVTGVATYLIDPDDMLKYGFLPGEKGD